MSATTIPHPVALAPAAKRNTKLLVAMIQAEPLLATVDARSLVLAMAVLRKRLLVLRLNDTRPQV